VTERRRPVRSAALQICVAVPDARLAARISKALLEQRLCACAQTCGPMTSRYTWKGKITAGREWLLVLKTQRHLYRAVERQVRRMHPYEIPEIIATPISHGFAAYVDWIAASTHGVRVRPAPSARSSRRRAASRP
jgi:periplasmic divalent cation tolerance protein